jgi:hypothetical protein
MVYTTPCVPKGRGEEKNFDCPKATTQKPEAKTLIQCYCDNTLTKPPFSDSNDDLFTKLLEYGNEEGYVEGSDSPWDKINTYILKDILNIPTANDYHNQLITGISREPARSDGTIPYILGTVTFEKRDMTILLYQIRSTLCRLYNCTYPRKKTSMLNKTIRNITQVFSLLFILLIYGAGLMKVTSSNVMQLPGWIFFALCNILLFAFIFKFKLQSIFIYTWVYVLIIFRIIGELTGHNGWILPFLINIGGKSLFSEELFFNFNFA